MDLFISNLLSFILITHLCTKVVTGISCWTCENAESLEQCNQYGKLTQCNPSQTNCGIEIRGMGSNRRMNIYKFCKQDTACLNMLNQNSGVLPNCSPFPNYVCRCCCSYSSCNAGTLDCAGGLVTQCSSIPTVHENSFMTCSDGKNIGSVCMFGCNEGYTIAGSTTTKCWNNGESPTWSNESPSCKLAHCSSTPKRPENGFMICSNHNSIGSVCTFECVKGYIVIGSLTTTCWSIGESPTWSNESPVCKHNQCDDLPIPPENGKVTCNGQILESKCEFFCDEGHFRVGRKAVICKDSEDWSAPEWNGKSPICYKVKCDPNIWAPTNGFMKCSNERFVGSICSFRCDFRYNLVGHRKSVCIINSVVKQVQWNYKQPKCMRKLCATMPSAPKNGQMFCSDQNYYGSVCAFRCDENHQRNGSSHTQCISENKLVDEEPEWDSDPPACNRLGCPSLQKLRFGVMSCSNGNLFGSECKFSCTEKGYNRYPKTRQSIVCKNDTSWTDEPPCCTRKCPPYDLVDVIFLLDSSSSIGENNWKIMTNFVKNIIDIFVVQEDSLNFGAIRYNSQIDSETKINLNDAPDNSTLLKELISKIPYNGKGTRTGEAMKYVQEEMFTLENGDRPYARNILLLLTDGRSHDDVTSPSELLKEQNISVYVLAMTPMLGALHRIQISDINQADKKLFEAEENFEKLTPKFAQKLSKNICGPPCK